MTKEKIAIIGAGISALSLATKLDDRFDIEIFEKARGVGGRMAVKYHENFQFDKGTQHFTCRSEEFKDFLQEFIDKDIVKLWHAKFVELDYDKIISTRKWNEDNQHFVCAPKMNILCKELAKNKNIKLQTKIVNCQKIDKKWVLYDEKNNQYGDFDYLIFSSPPEQTYDLIDKNFAEIDLIKNSKMVGCFALMLGLKEKLNLDFDAALVKNAIISWISLDSSKPDRPDGFSLLINSTNLWAEQHIENDIDEVKKSLINEVCNILKLDKELIDFCDIHRWRYANIKRQDDNIRNNKLSLFDENLKIGVCGDFLIQGRIESAFLSADHLAKKLK